MDQEPIRWVVYDRQTRDIEGVGVDREDAILDALDRSPLGPDDLEVETFDDLDLSQDASVICGSWIAASQEQYRGALLDYEHDRELRDSQ